MGDLFSNLCKGPVVVVDDMIDEADPINQIIEEIQENNLPVLKYKTISTAKNELSGLLLSNFIILDWVMVKKKEDDHVDVTMGAGAEAMAEEEVVEFIKDIQKISIAPIFILSKANIENIIDTIEKAGINKYCVFVENKNTFIKSKGVLISKIEKWISQSSHIYLSKWWTNEWLSNNTRIFWDLYNLDPEWPVWFYESFKNDGEEPILALVDSLFQLVYSEINTSSINESYMTKKIDKIENNYESLRKLYERLVYRYIEIDKDIRPGDIFKKDNKYYLNIRPECDTTKRIADPDLYLLEGEVKTPKEINDRYYGKFGIIDKEPEIIVLFLDNNDIVRFDKRLLSIKPHSELLQDFEKICRIAPPFITRIRQSYLSNLGRFGVPSYPKQIVDSLFETKEKVMPGQKMAKNSKK
jgi:hypothetical protein